MHFQVYYKFSGLSLLREPLMLISGFFFFFITCIIYMHADMSISKSSASYLAKLQWDEVQAAIQQVQNIINRCLGVHDKLEISLRDLSRTGDIQACKAADSYLKELTKDLKPYLTFLQSCPQAAQILPKMLATGSTDKTVKLWDLSNNQPSCVASNSPKAVWDTLSDAGVARRFGKYSTRKGNKVMAFVGHMVQLKDRAWRVSSFSNRQ